MPMSQQAVEPGDAALTRLEEITQIFEHRLECSQERFVMLQLIEQLMTTSKPLTQLKTTTQIGVTTREPIQLCELRFAKAASETSAWQTQCFANGVHTNLFQTADH